MMEDSLCPITFCPLKSGKNKFGVPYTLLLECGHHFDGEALLTWIKVSTNKNCPLCRGPPIVIFK
jgi:hypothetical protein